MKVTDEGVPVDTLISVVKDSIKRAGVSRTSQARDLQVASVQLILEVVASKTAGGGLDFRVPFIGMKLRVGGKVTRRTRTRSTSPWCRPRSAPPARFAAAMLKMSS